MDDDDKLLHEDKKLLHAILSARGKPHLISQLIRDYYRDRDRADRTPRDFLYLHMGILDGIVLGLLKRETRH